MSTLALDRPVVAGSALRSVKFFNGRLLTGDDLGREQSTIREREERLGRVVGDGVAHGFGVVEAVASSTKARPVVTVGSGLALTRSGIALALPADVDVALYRDLAAPPSDAEPGNLFADCQPSAAGTYTAGAGAYLLTVGAAAQDEGRAAVAGLGNDPAPCNVALSAEALCFRLIRLSVDPAVLSQTALLRNRLAWQCFGGTELAAVAIDPLVPAPDGYGLIDRLRTQLLTRDEVPLALIGWTIDDGIEFVDRWAVRRRPARGGPEGEQSLLMGDRRAAEAEAAVLQFADHVDDLVHGPSPATLAVGDAFEHLPPVGLLPITGGSRPGVSVPVFWSGVTTRGPFFVAGAQLEAIVQQASRLGPIDVSSGEVIWLYEVRENLDATAWPPGAVRGGPCVLFTSGHAPYAADAHFDLSRWDFANFALSSDEES